MTLRGGRDGGASARLTIGRVIESLRRDFPDITPSKVRFLEAEGLVTPERTPAGYRTYSPDEVDQLRRVLTAQRDWFLPLRVIREALTAGQALPGEASPGGPDRPDTASSSAPREHRDEPTATRTSATHTSPTRPATERRSVSLTAAELRDAAGIDRTLHGALESFGLIEADRFGRYDHNALDIARAAQRLAAHGLEPRHLRLFRTAADREAGLAQQVLAARHRDSSAGAGVDDILAAFISLHAALVRARLGGG